MVFDWVRLVVLDELFSRLSLPDGGIIYVSSRARVADDGRFFILNIYMGERKNTRRIQKG